MEIRVTDGYFTDKLDFHVDVRYLNDGRYLLLHDINYRWRGIDYPVPKDFISDGFTIPVWLQWALPKVPKRGLKASILHDYYVKHGWDDHNVPREIADEIFRSSLEYLHVRTRRVKIYYTGVSLYTEFLKNIGRA